MCWRALARATSLTSYLTGIGAVLFVVSDAAIAASKFYYETSAQEVIMSTYYAAQFLIAVSAAEEMGVEKRYKGFEYAKRK